MITFESKVSKKGRFKAPADIMKILGAKPGDRIVISAEPAAEDKECRDCIHIPAEILEEAGIDSGKKLEVFADSGIVIVQEADGCDE